MPLIIFKRLKEYPIPPDTRLGGRKIVGHYLDGGGDISNGAIDCSIGVLEYQGRREEAVEIRCTSCVHLYFLPQYVSSKNINIGFQLTLILARLKQKLDSNTTETQWISEHLIRDRSGVLKQHQVLCGLVDGQVIYDNFLPGITAIRPTPVKKKKNLVTPT